jgi:hypothetical protein
MDDVEQPADDHLLELRSGGAGPPEHDVRVERRGQHLADDARSGGRAAEVRKKARMLPVRQVGLEQALVVVEDGADRRGLLGRFPVEKGAQAAGLDVGQNRPAGDAGKVVGHHVHGHMSRGAEVGHFHVVEAGALLGIDLVRQLRHAGSARAFICHSWRLLPREFTAQTRSGPPRPGGRF